jgi:protein gp37
MTINNQGMFDEFSHVSYYLREFADVNIFVSFEPLKENIKCTHEDLCNYKWIIIGGQSSVGSKEKGTFVSAFTPKEEWVYNITKNMGNIPLFIKNNLKLPEYRVYEKEGFVVKKQFPIGIKEIMEGKII